MGKKKQQMLIQKSLSSSTLLGNAQSLLVAGGILRKREGVLKRRSDNMFKKLLPSTLWNKSYVVVERGSICINNNSDADNAVVFGASGFTLQGSSDNAKEDKSVEMYSISEIESIKYSKRGDKCFKIRIRDVANPTKSTLRMSKKKDKKNCMSITMRAKSGAEAEEWIKQVLLEVSNHAVLVQEMAILLKTRGEKPEATEELFKRAIQLWQIAFGIGNPHEVELMKIYSQWLHDNGRYMDACEFENAAAATKSRFSSSSSSRKSSAHLSRKLSRKNLASKEDVENLERFAALGASTTNPVFEKSERKSTYSTDTHHMVHRGALDELRELALLFFDAERNAKHASELEEENTRSKTIRSMILSNEQKFKQQAMRNAQRAKVAEDELLQYKKLAREMEDQIKTLQRSKDDSNIQANEKEIEQLIERRIHLESVISDSSSVQEISFLEEVESSPKSNMDRFSFGSKLSNTSSLINEDIITLTIDEEPDVMEEQKEEEEEVELGHGCYLVFNSTNKGTLIAQWSKSQVNDALAYFKPGNKVPTFKFTENCGRMDLIHNFLGGEGRKRYYQGWVQFVKLARENNGEITIFDPKGCNFFYMDTAFQIHAILPHIATKTMLIDAVCVIPPTSVFAGVNKMSKDSFTDTGNRIGAAYALPHY